MFHGTQHIDPSSFDVVEKLVTFYFHNLGSKWHFGDLQKMGGGGGFFQIFFSLPRGKRKKKFDFQN